VLRFAWRPHGLSDAERAELTELARAAAEEDAEAGFSQLDVAEPEDRAGHRRHELLVRRLPRETGRDVGLASEIVEDELPLVAYLRLTVSDEDGAGEVQYAVHPAHRSLGVSTALFEALGLEFPGWSGTSATHLTVWAHGNHPATRRMARRFGAETTRRLWKMTRPFWGDLAEELPEEPLLDGVAVRAMRQDADADGVKRLVERARGVRGVGRWTVTDGDHFLADGGFDAEDAFVAVRDKEVAAVVVVASPPPLGERRLATARVRFLGADPEHVTPGAQEALVLHVLHQMRDRGFYAASAYVDAADEDLTKVLLAATVEHEHSDVCYRVG
jgi:mycothiol synthase